MNESTLRRSRSANGLHRNFYRNQPCRGKMSLEARKRYFVFHLFLFNFISVVKQYLDFEWIPVDFDEFQTMESR